MNFAEKLYEALSQAAVAGDRLDVGGEELAEAITKILEDMLPAFESGVKTAQGAALREFARTPPPPALPMMDAKKTWEAAMTMADGAGKAMQTEEPAPERGRAADDVAIIAGTIASWWQVKIAPMPWKRLLEQPTHRRRLIGELARQIKENLDDRMVPELDLDLGMAAEEAATP